MDLFRFFKRNKDVNSYFKGEEDLSKIINTGIVLEDINKILKWGTPIRDLAKDVNAKEKIFVDRVV